MHTSFLRTTARLAAILMFQLFFVFLWQLHTAYGFTDVYQSPHSDTILRWKQEGLASGFEDGTFRPDSPITRAETVALVNRAFRFEEQSPISFSDVSSSDWFYRDVAIAKKAGYIQGFPDNTFKPYDAVTRQQLAVMIQGILKLPDSNAYTALADANKIPAWSRGAIGALIQNGISSDASNLFRPEDFATRAEVVAMLDQGRTLFFGFDPNYASSSENSNELGGPLTIGNEVIEGDFILRSSDMTLQNVVIKGNLILPGELNEYAHVMLINSTVHGSIMMEVPGDLSIFDSTVNELIVNVQKPVFVDGVDFVYANVSLFGNTSVQHVTLHTGADLRESDGFRADGTWGAFPGKGFGNITLQANYPSSHVTYLYGNFEHVNVHASKGWVEVRTGSVNEIHVYAGSMTTVVVNEGTIVDKIYLGSLYNAILGGGVIGMVVTDEDPLDMPENPWNYASGIAQLAGGGAVYNRETYIEEKQARENSGGSDQLLEKNSKLDNVISSTTLNGVKLNTSTQQLKQQLGEPDRIAITEQFFDWYIYNRNSKHFRFAVYEDKVIGFFTNSTDLLAGGLEREVGRDTRESISMFFRNSGLAYPLGLSVDVYNSAREDILFTQKYRIRFLYDTHNNDILDAFMLLPRFEETSALRQNVDRAQLDKDYAQNIFDMTDAFRAKYLSPYNKLIRDAAADQAAYLHSKDMYERNYFDHDNPEGQSPFDRMRNQGISFSYAGENIAMGYFDDIDAMNGWVNSLGHRSNMLTPQFTHLGVGVYHKYYTQNFFTPRR